MLSGKNSKGPMAVTGSSVGVSDSVVPLSKAEAAGTTPGLFSSCRARSTSRTVLTVTAKKGPVSECELTCFCKVVLLSAVLELNAND